MPALVSRLDIESTPFEDEQEPLSMSPLADCGNPECQATIQHYGAEVAKMREQRDQLLPDVGVLHGKVQKLLRSNTRSSISSRRGVVQEEVSPSVFLSLFLCV